MLACFLFLTSQNWPIYVANQGGCPGLLLVSRKGGEASKIEEEKSQNATLPLVPTVPTVPTVQAKVGLKLCRLGAVPQGTLISFRPCSPGRPRPVPEQGASSIRHVM